MKHMHGRVLEYHNPIGVVVGEDNCKYLFHTLPTQGPFVMNDLVSFFLLSNTTRHYRAVNVHKVPLVANHGMELYVSSDTSDGDVIGDSSSTMESTNRYKGIVLCNDAINQLTVFCRQLGRINIDTDRQMYDQCIEFEKDSDSYKYIRAIPLPITCPRVARTSIQVVAIFCKTNSTDNGIVWSDQLGAIMIPNDIFERDIYSVPPLFTLIKVTASNNGSDAWQIESLKNIMKAEKIIDELWPSVCRRVDDAKCKGELSNGDLVFNSQSLGGDFYASARNCDITNDASASFVAMIYPIGDEQQYWQAMFVSTLKTAIAMSAGDINKCKALRR